MAESTYSIALDGSSGYVSVADAAPLDPTSAITLSCWFKTSTTGTYQSLVVKPAGAFWGGAYAVWALRINASNALECWINDAGTYPGNYAIGSTNVTDGAWHHVAVTFDGSSLILYLDGTSQASQSISHALDTSTQPMMIGVDLPAAGDYFRGLLDDIALWDSALNGTQIGDLAAGSTYPQGISPAPAGLWHIEEGTGSTTADTSGNGNGGTLTGGVTWSSSVPVPLQGGGSPTPISDSDSAALSEGIPTLAVTLADSDSASLSQGVPTILANLSSSDSAAASESFSIAGSLAASDSATFTESGSVFAGLSVSDTDSFSFGEGSSSVAATVAGSDAGTLAEAGSIAASLSATDAATFTETGSVFAGISVSDSDSFGFAEGASALVAAVAAADTATFAQTASITAALSGSDSALSTEFASVIVVGAISRLPDPGWSAGTRLGPDPGRSSGTRLGPDPGRSSGSR